MALDRGKINRADWRSEARLRGYCAARSAPRNQPLRVYQPPLGAALTGLHWPRLNGFGCPLVYRKATI
jgi:hypothetical protein